MARLVRKSQARARPLPARVLQELRAFAAAGSGMPGRGTLADRLDVSGSAIETALRVLAQSGQVETLTPALRTRRPTIRLVASGQVLDGAAPIVAPDAHIEQKERRCLRCGGDFLSTWAGNRICEPCGSLNAAGLEAESYRLAPPTSRSRQPLSRGSFG